MSSITISTTTSAPIAAVWAAWTEPKHIVNWAFASDDWEAPSAENDLKTGGRFKTVMAAKDGSAAFDFAGTYTAVTEPTHIAYTMDDGRTVSAHFKETSEGGTEITQTFDPETENPEDYQRAGWQAILDNFTKYAESL